MFPNSGSRDAVPAAWNISKKLYEADDSQSSEEEIVENNSNLGLAQWAQFVEHDLSKPVSQSMGKFVKSLSFHYNSNSLRTLKTNILTFNN